MNNHSTNRGNKNSRSVLLIRPATLARLALTLAFAALISTATAQTNKAIGQSPALTGSAQVKLLGSKDVVQVKVYQEEDLDTKAVIDQAGAITLPLIGPVQIGNKSPDEAAEVIRSLYARDYLVNPQVSLTVLDHARIRFTVMGQVQRPGSYEFSTSERLNLLQAIAMAGGYTRSGSPSKISLQRVCDGRPSVVTVDVERMARVKKATPVEIQPDDIITVGEKMF
jgi:protein involved in polysaccharide export with SLBB domain